MWKVYAIGLIVIRELIVIQKIKKQMKQRMILKRSWRDEGG